MLRMKHENLCLQVQTRVIFDSSENVQMVGNAVVVKSVDFGNVAAFAPVPASANVPYDVYVER